MAFLEHKPVDCSIPYKKFQELKDSDIIYEIDYKEFEIKPYNIENVKIKKVPEYDDRKNCYEVEFNIPLLEKYRPFKVYDGNCFIFHNYGEHEMFWTTDKRIAEIIINIMKYRNSYQWECFSAIFGNQLAGRYEPRHIKLG